VGQPGTSEHRFSVERRPLLAIKPKHFVPVALQSTQGVNRRYLRLAIEMVIVFRTAGDGAFAGGVGMPTIRRHAAVIWAFGLHWLPLRALRAFRHAAFTAD